MDLPPMIVWMSWGWKSKAKLAIPDRLKTISCVRKGKRPCVGLVCAEAIPGHPVSLHMVFLVSLFQHFLSSVVKP